MKKKKKIVPVFKFLCREPNGRTCLTFHFTCWKVFVICQQLKFNKAHKAMPSLNSLYDLSYSHSQRAAFSCSVSFCRSQKGHQCQELWLPPGGFSEGLMGKNADLPVNLALYRHQVLILMAVSSSETNSEQKQVG